MAFGGRTMWLSSIVMREFAAQLLELAEKQGATTPRMSVMGNSLLQGQPLEFQLALQP
jgi:hypothetical protein